MVDSSLENTTALISGDVSYLHSPLFTVFIPTYCRVDLLKEAIDSVLNQWRVPFIWELLVVDNEEYNGVSNDTENLIKSYRNPRILYYRNKKHLAPADNFNLGFRLARGKWVMMLHDDDILIHNSLHNMYNVITAFEEFEIKVGAINAPGFKFINNPGKHERQLEDVHRFFLNQPTVYYFHKIGIRDVLFLGELSGDVSSCGATYNREAVLNVGGFSTKCVDNFGLTANKLLYHELEKHGYDVYSTTVPYGFQRCWGMGDPSLKPECIHANVSFWYEFRESVYSKNTWYKIWGTLFREIQHRKFCVSALLNRKVWTGSVGMKLNMFEDICTVRVNRLLYNFYLIVLKGLYLRYRDYKMNRFNKKILKFFGDKIKYRFILECP